jgi:hypothetical protein
MGLSLLFNLPPPPPIAHLGVLLTPRPGLRSTRPPTQMSVLSNRGARPRILKRPHSMVLPVALRVASDSAAPHNN